MASSLHCTLIITHSLRATIARPDQEPRHFYKQLPTLGAKSKNPLPHACRHKEQEQNSTHSRMSAQGEIQKSTHSCMPTQGVELRNSHAHAWQSKEQEPKSTHSCMPAQGAESENPLTHASCVEHRICYSAGCERQSEAGRSSHHIGNQPARLQAHRACSITQ
jgi:hypothetical protein